MADLLHVLRLTFYVYISKRPATRQLRGNKALLHLKNIFYSEARSRKRVARLIRALAPSSTRAFFILLVPFREGKHLHLIYGKIFS